jgi:hypothetical protein
MYRDWQENSLNSDGSFSLWIYAFGAAYLVHLLYSFMIPYYWMYLVLIYFARGNTPVKNEEYVQLRMKDAIGNNNYSNNQSYYCLGGDLRQLVF